MTVEQWGRWYWRLGALTGCGVFVSGALVAQGRFTEGALSTVVVFGSTLIGLSALDERRPK